MTKYVLEACGDTNIGLKVESRSIFDTYEDAKACFDNTLRACYTEEELADEELVNECSNKASELQGYIDDWMDEENDIFLFIYEVKEAKYAKEQEATK